MDNRKEKKNSLISMQDITNDINGILGAIDDKYQLIQNSAMKIHLVKLDHSQIWLIKSAPSSSYILLWGNRKKEVLLYSYRLTIATSLKHIFYCAPPPSNKWPLLIQKLQSRTYSSVLSSLLHFLNKVTTLPEILQNNELVTKLFHSFHFKCLDVNLDY